MGKEIEILEDIISKKKQLLKLEEEIEMEWERGKREAIKAGLIGAAIMAVLFAGVFWFVLGDVLPLAYNL